MNFFDERFPFRIVAEAAGLKHDTAAKWISRNYLVMSQADQETSGPGAGKKLTARTSQQTILAAELNRRGMRPEDACEAAISFAHEGEAKGHPLAAPGRKPGHLFSDGLTLFFLNREDPRQSNVRYLTGEEPIKRFSTQLDAVDLEMLFHMRIEALGVERLSAISDMKASNKGGEN